MSLNVRAELQEAYRKSLPHNDRKLTERTFRRLRLCQQANDLLGTHFLVLGTPS